MRWTSNNTIRIAKLTLEFKILIVLWVDHYSAAGRTRWRLGFTEDGPSRVCCGNKSSLPSDFNLQISSILRYLSTATSTSRYGAFHKATDHTLGLHPNTLLPLESWRSQLSLCVISLGCQTGQFLNYNAQKVDILLERNHCQIFGYGSICTLPACGLEELFFQLCYCVRFSVLAGNSFWCYLST